MTLSSVPVLLNEFPVPPSYIPQNISAPSQNPPPSRPPSLPLPPIPGPSPLSEQDLIHITAATRSRRASRISTSSRSSSLRESVISVASGSSGPSPIPATTQPQIVNGQAPSRPPPQILSAPARLPMALFPFPPVLCYHACRQPRPLKTSCLSGDKSCDPRRR
ncbi:hypothetical protein EI94DRAFT_1156485 [Lactarius quietus]|nr:hypothetical protein EI94DRAFT_1156485 [Lactarius quietus]